ncbi:MAG: hypothetical protein U9R39_03235 [Campylobacterota bacterium]|nr:hypothetical protein [Campylobacterota bacterium]
MKKLSLLITIMLFFGGCQYNKVPNFKSKIPDIQSKIPDIQSKEYPRYLYTIPIVDNILFKYPTKEYTAQTIITTTNDLVSKMKYSNKYNVIINNDKYNNIQCNIKMILNEYNIKAKCNSLIDLENNSLISSKCNLNNIAASPKALLFISSLMKIINDTPVNNQLLFNNNSVKSGSILYKTIGADLDQLFLTLIKANPNRKQKNEQFLKTWNEVKKDLEYEVIVKGWGLYNNKRVIVTQFQQEIDISNFFYKMLKKLNKVQNKEEFNKAFGNKTIFTRLVGYELYDPNTFIKVFSKNTSYVSMLGKITKKVEVTKSIN